MQLALRQPDLEFQAEVRRFIDRHWPQRFRGSLNAAGDQLRDRKPEVQSWFDALVTRHWSVPNWPVDQGGADWSPMQNLIWDREAAQAQTPLMSAIGVDMLGLMLCRFASPEQHSRFLPPIRESRVRWSHGCWESAADADCAALTAVATRGLDYLVNGEITCITDSAQRIDRAASWMFALVKTRADASRREGVSFLLIDMHSDGIRIKPVATLGARFAVEHVSLTEVLVPAGQRIGPENQGWSCAQALGNSKPFGGAGPAVCRVQLERLGRTAAETPSDGASVADEEAFQRTYRELEIDLLGLEMLELRIVADDEPSRASEPGSPGMRNILRLGTVGLGQRIADLMVETLGYYAIPCPDDLLIDNEGSIGHDYALTGVRGWMLAHESSIYGESIEDQKDVIARSALGL
jgi:alkylation response protein AidB-like acyl-CoA dehydrogenase